MNIRFQRKDAPTWPVALPLPSRGRPDDAGIDLRAAHGATIVHGMVTKVALGFAVEIPQGCVGLHCIRSGLAAEHGITLVNSPGIIDLGYRGELVALMTSLVPGTRFRIERGDRVTQLVIVPLAGYESIFNITVIPMVVEVDDLGETERGTGGFGSSGTR